MFHNVHEFCIFVIPTVSLSVPPDFIKKWVNQMATGFSSEMFRH